MSNNSNSMFARVDQEISENKFYESMQHILTLVKRNTMRKKYEESMETLYKYALVYLDKSQYVLSGELMDEYSKVAESGSLDCDTDHVNRLVTVFEFPWKTSPDSSTFRQKKDYSSVMSLFTKFMNRAILWSKSDEHPNGNPLLHKSLGLYYKFDKQYSKAQANLVYSQDVEAIFELVNEWKDQGNEEEGNFFYLRAVLMLLACKDVYNAKSFVYMLNYDLEDPKTPLPIQFAYLLTECCDPPNFDLFKELCETYKDLVNKDKEYSNLVKSIQSNYFSDRTHSAFGREPGLDNTLSSFIQALI